ncbi:MAG: type I glyceraldehyde-3-phosphate dehydrogenase [Candidatus Saganbacteria bacterium]|nr:type I glyceraldehyde-3-phosphate dehydrogenase [Candidatus Saganbacteria bacterium]
MVRIGINGFGRIGRCVTRLVHEGRVPGAKVVAANDLVDTPTLAHLLKYDSVHRIMPADVSLDGDSIIKINDTQVHVSAERDPAKIPWSQQGVDVVLECTGRFRTIEDASKHLAAGAKKVIISAPFKGEGPMFVMGVNDDLYNPDTDDVISNASCTTNCSAPVAMVMDQNFGIRNGWLTTIHSYTMGQNILDAPSSDLRRARAAAVSMVPTSTGAAAAIGKVLPDLAGKLAGFAIRVPTPNVSLVDFTLNLKTKVTAERVNEVLKAAAAGPLKGVMKFNEVPLVSVDFMSEPVTSIVEAERTTVMDQDVAKLLVWYDNEMGYSNQFLHLAKKVGDLLS